MVGLEGFTRREFVSLAPAALLGLSLRGTLAAGPDVGVVIAKNDLPEYLLRASIRELGGIDRYVKEGDLVAVKPNFSFDCVPNSDVNAANTDPDLVKAVVKLCLEAGASEIKVIDNTLTEPPELGLRSSQLKGKLAQFDTVECKVLNNKPQEFEKVNAGRSLGEIGVSKDVLEADVLVNLPKLKNHAETVATISMKNLMGIIDDRQRIHDQGLHRPIADLTSYLLSTQAASGQRNLVVVDAIKALQSGGPDGPGKVIRPNSILVGDNPVSVDAYGCDLLGIDRTTVPHLEIASKEYMLAGSEEGWTASTLDVSQMAKDDLLPGPTPKPEEPRSGRWAFLLPAGVAVGACIAVGFIYSRKARRPKEPESPRP